MRKREVLNAFEQNDIIVVDENNPLIKRLAEI